MKHLLFLFPTLLLFTTLSAQPLQRKVDVLDRSIEEARQYWEVPGMSVAIVKNGEVLLAKGYGERELGNSQTVNKNTIFNIGSTTKAFTAVLIGMLVDE